MDWMPVVIVNMIQFGKWSLFCSILVDFANEILNKIHKMRKEIEFLLMVFNAC